MLKFDNSHCWTHSKEVFYSVKVMLPEEERASLPQKHALTDTECLGTNEAAYGNEVGVPEQQEDSTSLYFTPSPGSGSLSPADSREEIDR